MIGVLTIEPESVSLSPTSLFVETSAAEDPFLIGI